MKEDIAPKHETHIDGCTCNPFLSDKRCVQASIEKRKLLNKIKKSHQLINK